MGLTTGKINDKTMPSTKTDASMRPIESEGLKTKCLLMDFDNTLFNSDSRRDKNGKWLPGFPVSSIPGYKLYDGWREVFSWAQENKVKIGIVSTTPKDHIQTALDHFGLQVDAIFGKVKKNSGKVLLTAIEEMGGTVSETLYVGDHRNDADIARMAGVPFAGAVWDSWHEARLAARRCLTISSPTEIINLFDHLADILKPIKVSRSCDCGISVPSSRKGNIIESFLKMLSTPSQEDSSNRS